MGRDLRRSGGGYRTAGPTAASCRGDPDQGLQLSAARTHRPGAVACANPHADIVPPPVPKRRGRPPRPQRG